jgi:hypothetical protein
MRRFGIAIGTATALSSLLIGGAVVNAQDTTNTVASSSTVAGSSTTVAGSSTTTASSSTPSTLPATPAPAGAGTFTLPLLTTPLSVAVTTDVGGGLLDVSLTGTNAATLAPDAVKPGKVAFVNEAGTVKVKVSAKDGGQRVQVRAGALADISGAGGWTGDVFGDGGTTTVDFMIGAGSDGGPDITAITVTSPAQFTIGNVERSTDTDDDDGEIEQEAKVTISFTQNGQSRKLTVKAEVETENGVTESKLRISLGRLKGAALVDGVAVGPHTWSGTLCDGTAATISYTVNADGSISGVTATPAAEVSGDDDEVKVRFSSDDRVRIETDDDDGALTVRVRERFRCDRVLPTVNGQQVSTSTTIDDEDEDDDDNRGRGRGGDDDDDDDDGDDDGDDDDRSSTSVAGASSTTVDDDDDDDDDSSGRGGDDDGGDDDSGD